jgi:3'(2'),5'-bisphosphate nucleotidase
MNVSGGAGKRGPFAGDRRRQARAASIDGRLSNVDCLTVAETGQGAPAGRCVRDQAWYIARCRVPFERELAVAEEAARRAGAVIMSHYQAGPTSFETKTDGSPVSRADLEANAALLARLAAAFPDDGVLSEESPEPAAAGRLRKERVWILDPLDGTRGFLARTDDFAVHVALAVAGVPTVSVVYQPVADVLFRAVAGQGAVCVRQASVNPLRVSDRAALADQRIGISRHNAPAALLDWLQRHRLAAQAVALGASLKYTALAAGELDAVVTVTGGEKEWDTCAPELIVTEAGGVVTDGDGARLRYNQPADALARRRGVVASNGRCHAEIIDRLRPLLDAGHEGEGPRA